MKKMPLKHFWKHIKKIPDIENFHRIAEQPDVQTIAASCGINDSNYFTSIFKKFQEMTLKNIGN